MRRHESQLRRDWRTIKRVATVALAAYVLSVALLWYAAQQFGFALSLVRAAQYAAVADVLVWIYIWLSQVA